VKIAKRTLSVLAHLTLDMFLGWAAFTVVITGLTLALSLAVTVIGGVAALAATVAVALWFARFQRGMANLLLDANEADPLPDRRVVRFGTLGRLITSPQGWKAVAYSLLQPVINTVLFSVVISVWAAAALLVTAPLWGWAVPSESIDLYLFSLSSLPGFLFASVIGLALVALGVVVTLLAGQVVLAMVRAFLGQKVVDRLRAEVDAAQVQVAQLDDRRTAALEAAEAERRRIERDLHDGAQQRLVSLGMTIGMAREKLDTAPEEARLLLEEAHTDAKAAMTELRSIARGIHPAILEDRGLDAALSSLAAKSSVPVTIRNHALYRYPKDIEAACYFVIAESLTNIAKHSVATEATIEIADQQGGLRVEITDDGIGGAELAPYGGLSGLRDRVVAFGGTFHVESPLGGPTIVTALIPAARIEGTNHAH
jgi:signal transduction histidine kinase